MTGGQTLQVINDVIKSDVDTRFYRGLELTNGMKIMLVSDPDTDKSAAAIDVHVGHMCDPPHLPGLAHFLEHMLFLGTEKYPSENEYNKFLSEHGGSGNAFTAADHTNYYFDVAPQHLAGALDRFAQFFLCPLFTESASDREVNAVNSEHEKNIQNDMWRLNQLEKSTANPMHAFSKFGTGNKETLDAIPKSQGINVREELLNFHNQWYSSNIMSLAVLGRESLDELEEMVVPLFAGVHNKNVAVPEWLEHPFGSDELKKIGNIVPVKDIRSLNITFPIPDLQPFYRTSPGHYLGHLIGHEGKGSLLSELKSKGLVNTLLGGQKTGAKGFGFFIVNVDLTEEGIEHVDDIVTHLFQYLAMLQLSGPQLWVFEECRDLSAMSFKFKDKERPGVYVCALAGLLQDYPIQETLCGPYLLQEYRSDLIQMVLDKLTTDNIRIAVIGKKFDGVTDLKERWYGTDYRLKQIDDYVLLKWQNVMMNSNLSLPTRNEFIPTNFSLVPREEEPTPLPVLIKDTDLSRVWFKQDNEFLLPKALLHFEFISPLAYMDPLHCNMAYMFVQLFKDFLTEYAYAAELAGLSYALNNTKYGMFLTIKGYSDKQHILLNKIIEKLVCFQVDVKRYEILKEAYVRGLKNFQAEQPTQHALYYTSLLLAEHAWSKDELLEATEEMTISGQEAFITEILSKLHIECLIHGNLTKQQALGIVSSVEEKLMQETSTRALLSSQLVRDREVHLAEGSNSVYKTHNEVHNNSCIEAYYQCGIQETTKNVLLELMSQILCEPCFNILRTQEQLGYIVTSGVKRAHGAQGFRVIVQSDKHPEYIASRIEAFIETMEIHLGKMSAEDFKRHKDALVARRLEKPKKLGEQSQKYWAEIVSRQYNFDRDNVEVAQLKKLTKADVFQFFKEYVSCHSESRRKLAVHVISRAPGGAGNLSPENLTNQIKNIADGLKPAPVIKEATVVEDITEFKSSHGLYPLVQPYFVIPKLSSKSKL